MRIATTGADLVGLAHGTAMCVSCTKYVCMIDLMPCSSAQHEIDRAFTRSDEPLHHVHISNTFHLSTFCITLLRIAVKALKER